MTDAWNTLYEKLEGWGAGFIKMLPNLGISIIVLTVTIFLSLKLKKVAIKLMNRFSDNKAVNSLIATVLTVLIILAGLFISLGILGLDKTVTSLLAGAGVVGLAVGLAFQEPIINTISGVVLAVRKNVRLGELVESNDHLGTVKIVNLRETILETMQGQMVIIPNKSMIQNPLKNYSRYGKRRIDLTCGVSYGDDLKKVRRLAIKAIEQIKYVSDDEIDFIYTEFGDSSINFTLRYWIEETKQGAYLHAKSEGIMNLKTAFDNNDILIPFPITTLDFDAKGGKTLRTMLPVHKDAEFESDGIENEDLDSNYEKGNLGEKATKPEFEEKNDNNIAPSEEK